MIFRGNCYSRGEIFFKEGSFFLVVVIEIVADYFGNVGFDVPIMECSGAKYQVDVLFVVIIGRSGVSADAAVY